MCKMVLVGVLLCLSGPVGCGADKPQEVLERRGLNEVTAEANELSVNGLERQARAYRDAIHYQQGELDRLRQAKKSLEYKEQRGPAAQEMDSQMQRLAKSIERLTKRHQIYIAKLRQKGRQTDEFEL